MSQETIYFMLHKILDFEKFEDRIFDLENKNVELEANWRILKDQLDKLTQNGKPSEAADSENQIQSSKTVQADDTGSNFVENHLENDKISTDQNQGINFGQTRDQSREMNATLNAFQDEDNKNWDSNSTIIKENVQIFPVSDIQITSVSSERESQNLESNLNLLAKNSKALKILQNVVIPLKRVDSDPNFKPKLMVSQNVIQTNLKKSDDSSEKFPISSLHSGSRNYQCKICTKFFKFQPSLDNHMKVHKRCEGKAFKCSTCSMVFPDKIRLKNHNRVHTGEKPYSCTVCPKKFTQGHNLIIHNRIHTGERPYKCQLCSRKFSQSTSLAIHTRTHTGEKPYICEFCPRKFPYRQGLVLHTRSHTGEKPYDCPVCKRKFSDSSSRYKHVKSAHTK